MESETPFYRFSFGGGLSSVGTVVRDCEYGGNQTRHSIPYRLIDLPLVIPSGRSMSAPISDLLDVSTAIYIADRLAPREYPSDSRSPGNRWHRSLHVQVPVRQPDRWKEPEIQELLFDLLSWLTDDHWRIEFLLRTANPRHSEAQLSLLPRLDHLPSAVALQSGGLDSLYGLTSLLSNSHWHRVVPVTVVTNARLNRSVKSLHSALQQADPSAARLSPARIWIQISGAGRPRDDRESTQRARSMLFLASGIAAAATMEVNAVHVTENGIGAINLPMTPDHWGSRATRAVHPVTLEFFSNLASRIIGRQFVIKNDALFRTKGSLVHELSAGQFTAAISKSSSCDRNSYLRPDEACGKCSSCILRRIAISSGGPAINDSTQYQVDIRNSSADCTPANLKHLVPMHAQVEMFRQLTAENSQPVSLYLAFPDLLGVVDCLESKGIAQADAARLLTQLLASHVVEVDHFMAQIRRPGWGSLLRPVDELPTQEPMIAAS